MIHQNSWDNKIEVVKGNYAEDIINDYLEMLGYILYSPKTKGAHAFDRMAIKNKSEIIIAECKAKARRNKYPDTGIDLNNYKGYKNIQDKHNLKVFIFFIDEMIGKIYGNFINELEKEKTISGKKYPSIEPTKYGKEIIYFPLENMIDIKELTQEQILFLKQSSKRNYEYAGDL